MNPKFGLRGLLSVTSTHHHVNIIVMGSFPTRVNKIFQSFKNVCVMNNHMMISDIFYTSLMAVH